MDAGDSQAQFDLDDYQTKDALISAIEALPMISASGNNISGAMRTLRQEVLSFGWRGYDNYIQKVAMTFTDERARDSEALTRAYQVLDHHGPVTKPSIILLPTPDKSHSQRLHGGDVRKCQSISNEIISRKPPVTKNA